MMNEKVRTESGLQRAESVGNEDREEEVRKTNGGKRNRKDGGPEMTGINNYSY